MTTELFSPNPTITDIDGNFKGPYVRTSSGIHLGDYSHAKLLMELDITEEAIADFGRGEIEPKKQRATFYDDSHDFGYNGDLERIVTGQVVIGQLEKDWNVIIKNQSGQVLLRSSDQSGN